MRTFLFLLIVIGGLIASVPAYIIITAPARPPVDSVAKAARSECVSEQIDSMVALGVHPRNTSELVSSARRLCDRKGIYAP
jgi:hypothetical protein